MADLNILCAADLHLGRASAWLDGPEQIDRTSVGAWKRIVDRAIEECADAVALAGDVFDSTGSYYETRQSFRSGLERLKLAGIPVIAVSGNHDWEALPRFTRQFPDTGLVLLGEQGTWERSLVQTRSGPLQIVGWSFPGERVHTSAFRSFVPQTASNPTLGLVHGEIAAESDYNPFTPSDLASGADAWVLGHIHRPRNIGARAAYPGSPQALDFGLGEQDAHGFLWLQFRNAIPTFMPLEPVSTVRFEVADLTVRPDGSRAILEVLEEQIEQLADGYRFRSAASSAGGTTAIKERYLESVQLRLRISFLGLDAVPRIASGVQLCRSRNDAWQMQEARIRCELDPWERVAGRDVAGEVARLLLGAAAEDGEYKGRIVDPEWVGKAEQLVSVSAADVLRSWRATTGQVSDGGDAFRPEPDPERARATARRALIGELGELLQEVSA